MAVQGNERKKDSKNAQATDNDNSEDAVKEYDLLDTQLDELNSALDVLEKQNDSIQSKLRELLKSNIEIRESIKQENAQNSLNNETK